MYRLAIAATAVFFCTPFTSSAQAKDGPDNETGNVAIVQKQLTLNDKFIQVGFEIRNGSAKDVWVCESVDDGSWGFEVYLSPDNETLVVRRRLGIAAEGRELRPTGRYARLRSGEGRMEVMSFSLPIHNQSPLYFRGRDSQSRERAKRIVLQIGYYDKDPPTTTIRAS
jgi:hypothetical protein